MQPLEDKPNRVWTCKVGFAGDLPPGSDAPMRAAVEEAFLKLTGEYPRFQFSGWGGSLTESELAVVENRLPRERVADGSFNVASNR